MYFALFNMDTCSPAQLDRISMDSWIFKCTLTTCTPRRMFFALYGPFWNFQRPVARQQAVLFQPPVEKRGGREMGKGGGGKNMGKPPSTGMHLLLDLLLVSSCTLAAWSLNLSACTYPLSQFMNFNLLNLISKSSSYWQVHILWSIVKWKQGNLG